MLLLLLPLLLRADSDVLDPVRNFRGLSRLGTGIANPGVVGEVVSSKLVDMGSLVKPESFVLSLDTAPRNDILEGFRI